MPLNDKNGLNYWNNDYPICPFCDEKINISQHDLWHLLSEDEPHEVECPYCEKDFTVYSSARWSFDTSEQEDVEDETEVEP